MPEYSLVKYYCKLSTRVWNKHKLHTKNAHTHVKPQLASLVKTKYMYMLLYTVYNNTRVLQHHTNLPRHGNTAIIA